MARGIQRARTKNRPERSRVTEEWKEAEAELEAMKATARERLVREQELISRMVAWCEKRFDVARKAGDVDEVGKLLKIMGEATKRELATLSKRQVGRPPKAKAGGGEGVPSQDRAGLLESLAHGQGSTKGAVA